MADVRAWPPELVQHNIAAFLVDARADVLGWTAGAAALLGYESGEAVGRSAVELLTPQGVSGAQEEWDRRARTGAPWSAPMEFRSEDGKNVAVSTEALPLVGEGGVAWFVAVTPLAESATRRLAGPHPPPTQRLGHSPLELCVYDAQTRCLWANDGTVRRDRARGQDRVGRRMRDIYPPPEVQALESAVRDVFDSGIPVIDRESRYPQAGQSQEALYVSTCFRLDGRGGEPLGVCVMTMDTSGPRERRHLLMLSEASKKIGTTLDVMKTAQELADVVVPLLADYATVDLEEWVPTGADPDPEPPTDTPAPGTPVFRRAGAASIHPDMPEALRQVGQSVLVPASSPFTHALFSRRSHYEPVLDTAPGAWLDRDPARARVIRATGMHSLIIVPLQARGTVLGEAVFVRTDNPEPFSEDDLLLIEELAGRASLSLDNARRFTRERAASLTLQRSLLPRRLSGGRAAEVASRYFPADSHEGAGGDWFDVIPLSRDRIGLVVGDIVGHGIGAAARMGQFRTVVRTLAELDLPPDQLLTRLDQLVVHLIRQDAGEQGDIGFSSPILGGTCLYAVYDPADRSCTITRAGHPPPALVEPGGRVTFPDLPSGAPIGIGLTAYERRTLEIPVGSTLVLYTDGLVESPGEDLDTGFERLRTALREAAPSLEDMCDNVIRTMAPQTPYTTPSGQQGNGRTYRDDIALLLVRTRALTPDSP